MSPVRARARVCVLTPQGRGAVAVVRVWGPSALGVADAAFRPRRGLSLAESPPGRLRLGRMGAGMGDEVVAVVIADEPPEVEVYAHGGAAAVALVVEALVSEGAEVRRPVAWVRHDARAAIAAEAFVDLARASTVRTAEILLEQAQGALEADIREALDALADHPAEAIGFLDALLDLARVGLRLIAGWRVVLAGRPNVGKSRLLNALAGYDRAIVDAMPGTTRDVVTARTALEGWPVELADTAGLRPSDDPIETSGVALARARQGEADLVLVVLDRSEPLTDIDRAVVSEHARGLIVANKCDLPAAWSPADLGAVAVSAQHGDGIEELVAGIASRLVPDLPPPSRGVPFRASQVRRLQAARNALVEGDHGTAIRNLAAMCSDLPRPFDRAD